MPYLLALPYLITFVHQFDHLMKIFRIAILVIIKYLASSIHTGGLGLDNNMNDPLRKPFPLVFRVGPDSKHVVNYTDSVKLMAELSLRALWQNMLFHSRKGKGTLIRALGNTTMPVL